MPLGKEVGLGPGHIVLDGDPVGSQPQQQPLPIFGPCLLWPNGHPSQQLLSSCIILSFKLMNLICLLMRTSRCYNTMEITFSYKWHRLSQKCNDFITFVNLLGMIWERMGIGIQIRMEIRIGLNLKITGNENHHVGEGGNGNTNCIPAHLHRRVTRTDSCPAVYANLVHLCS